MGKPLVGNPNREDSRRLKAGVAELADATDSKSVARKGVWVRSPPPALIPHTPAPEESCPPGPRPSSVRDRNRFRKYFVA